MPQYLSTDPNAGEPMTGGYLSTDPNAGEPEAPAEPDTSMLDTLIGLLPAAGGTLGGIVGGIGGTAFGMGIGGVPGAVGGATLGGAAGESLRQLANRARGKPSPETSMRALKELGTQGAVQGAAEAVGGAVMKGAAKGARAVYRGYLKPSLSERMLPKANEIVETALKEALPVTRRGSAKAQTVMTELRSEVDRLLESAKGTVDLHAIAERVRAFAKKRYMRAGKPLEDYDAAMKVADNLDKHPSLMKPGPKVAKTVESKILNPQGKPVTRTEMVPGPPVAKTKVSLPDANLVKRGLDDSVGEANFGVERGATKTSQKVARHHTRRVIEDATGGPSGAVAKLNARESKLIDAAKAIARAVEREANQNPLYGVKTLAASTLGGGVGYSEGGAPGAIAGTLATRAALRPAVTTRAAILANRLQKQLGVSAATAGRLAAYVLSDDAQGEQ